MPRDRADMTALMPGAQGVNVIGVIGPVREQAGLRRVRPAASKPRTACHAQAQGTAPSIRQARDRGAETVPFPAATENGDKRAFKRHLHWIARYVLFWPS